MTKLPVVRLVRHAYLDAIGNARGLFQVGGLWLLLSWALLLLARNGSVFFMAAADLAVTVGAAAIAVAWHRHILLNEPLTKRMAPLDARVARYFVLTVLVALLMSTVPALVFVLSGGAFLAAGPGAAAPGLGPLLSGPLAALVCLYLALRLQLVFPATAIGDETTTFRRSWELTRGHGWRLLLGFLLIALPVAAVTIGLAILLNRAAEATGSLAVSALADLAAVGNAWLQAPLIASFLSYVYTWCREQKALPPPSGPWG
ncbi:hypothetical protein [Benzoatithermus flavus]|uniref:Glycerophosphoryl diester phosphodiesterase membrane domain-containing protein n=1 Tax=Benzoatithermus flavus TaxID=3108223 RepID=A0ABU8XQJ4_9PROT